MDPITMMMLSSAIGGGTGILNQKAAKEKDFRDQIANAEMMRYSPWTGMNVGYRGATAPSAISAGLQGGVAGAMQGQKFGEFFKGSPSSPVAPEAEQNPWMRLGRQYATNSGY